MTAGWRLGVLSASILALAAGPIQARIALPGTPVTLPPVGGLLAPVQRAASETIQVADGLASARLERLGALVRRSGRALEMTREGPAVRSEIIAVDPGPDAMAAAGALGLRPVSEAMIAGLGLRTMTFAAPDGADLDALVRRLQKTSPGGAFTANHIYLPSGSVAGSTAPEGLPPPGDGAGGVGVIDGAVAAHPAITGAVEQRGFARGAPRASAHATAVASLVAGTGVVRGPAPGAPLLVADVYGDDKAGGNALAIAQALGWIVGRNAPVVVISLVGPPNVLLERAVRAAQARGLTLVAAVGNDGPAAPPAYPASYAGVIAVTAVDGRGRPLIEAGHSLHVDFAAPGADMVAASLARRTVVVRGTSYAAPLVAALWWRAARAGAQDPEAALARDAAPMGRAYGHGLVCGACRTLSAH